MAFHAFHTLSFPWPALLERFTAVYGLPAFAEVLGASACSLAYAEVSEDPMWKMRLLLAPALMLGDVFSAAQQKPYTDLTLDHLAGPVRSAVVSVSVRQSDVRLPSGPSVVMSVMRERCEYDPDGTKTLGETQQKGGPYGESMVIGRDPQGHLYDRRTLDRQTGQMTRYERFGPHGVIDDRRYSGGKLTDEFIQDWDENGYRSTFVASDGQGRQVSNRRTMFTADGVMTNDSSWNANGLLQWSNTYDPATGVSHFTNYDAKGTLRLSRHYHTWPTNLLLGV